MTVLSIPSIGGAYAEEFSGRRCQRDAGAIAVWHREPGMPGYEEAVAYVRRRAHEVGLQAVEFRRFPWDGQHHFFDNWYTTPCWEIHDASLQMLEPHQAELANATEIPVSLGLRSASTPADGVISELVFVGAGVRDSDYAGKDVRGKIVLLEPHGQLSFTAVDTARRHGVAGAVLSNLIDNAPYWDRIDRPYMVGHTWTTHWYLGSPHDFRQEIFTFSISHRQATWLKELLERGRVVVRARVNTTFRSGEAGTLTATIPGTHGGQEVVLLAHLDHPWPGANDNASGVALLLETARTIRSLIGRGILPAPRQTVRLIWPVHLIGTAAWLAQNPLWADRVIVGFNCDSVGGRGSTGARAIEITCAPDAAPTFVNDLVDQLAENAPSRTRSFLSRREPPEVRWSHRLRPYTRGSDHAPLNDNATPVPCLNFGAYPYLWYHTDQDTVEHTDPLEFERQGWVVGMAVALVACAREPDAIRFAQSVASRSRTRLDQVVQDVLWQAPDTTERDQAPLIAQAYDRLGYLAERDQRRLATVFRLTESETDDGTLRAAVDALQLQVIADAAIARERLLAGATIRLNANDVEEAFAPSGALERLSTRLFPRKLLAEPVNYRGLQRTLESRLGASRLAWMTDHIESLPYPVPTASGLPDALHWADGTNSIWEIRRRVLHEYGWGPPLEVLHQFFKDLVEAGLASWVPRPNETELLLSEGKPDDA